MDIAALRNKTEYEILIERKKYEMDADFFSKNYSVDYRDLSLYHVKELTYEDKSPRREAFENIISSFREDGVIFLYLLIGDEKKVSFYLGVMRDKFSKAPSIDIRDLGKNILKPTIEGNFRGSKIELVDRQKKEEILNSLNVYNHFGIIDGVPGINESEDKRNFQGIDRLVDVMLGDRFGLGILVKPIDTESFHEIEERLYVLYTKIAPLVKQTYQHGKNFSENIGKNMSENITKSTNESRSSNTSRNWNSSKTTNDSKTTGVSNNEGSSSGSGSNSTNKSKGTNSSRTEGNSETTGYGISNGNSDTEGSSISENITSGKNTGSTTGESSTLGMEIINKNAQEWLKYIDEMLFPMMDYGRSKGLYLASTFIFTENRMNLIKLGSTIQSLFSGRKGNKMALQLEELDTESEKVKYLKNFQIPRKEIVLGNGANMAMIAKSKLSLNNIFQFANIYSPNEISILTGLPQKEVVGLSLKEEVEFGLNFPEGDESDNIELGHLIQIGRELKNIKVGIDRENLNKHIFIAGVTGSGKTTTCQKILKKSGLPFLVIEPAKTEYRILTEEDEEVIIFTLGKDTVAPFRINPFEFFAHESITARVDMIKASIEASFDMEAAIPQLIETIIYRCYEDYGWNIATNRNYKFKDPFTDGVYSFPTLKDIIKKIEIVVGEQGFDSRLNNDYIGSIKARLQSLVVGAKGLMLNTPRTIDFKELLESKVVLELEEIKSASEKSLIMGFILGNLSEALKAKHKENKKFRHITLVEEAHRLLSKYVPGDSPNKKQGVELFSDMLAEVRKYGESLIIVDQIPNKLTSEVLKNTNTKVVHKIFAEDDKEAIGNTMNLSSEQKKYLSSLGTGEVVLFSQGWDKAIQVQIEKETDTTGRDEIDEKKIHKNAMKFYSKCYRKGIVVGTQLFDKGLTWEETHDMVYINQNFYCEEEFIKLVNGDILLEKESLDLQRCINECGKNIENLIKFIYCKYYLNLSYSNNHYLYEKICGDIEALLKFILENETIERIRDIFKKRNYRGLYIPK